MECKERLRSFGKKVRETIVSLLVAAIWVIFTFLPVILGYFFPSLADNRSYTSQDPPPEYEMYMGRM